MKILKNIAMIIFVVLYALMNVFIADTINRALINAFDINIEYILLILVVIGTIVAVITVGLLSKNVGAVTGKIGLYSFGFSVMAFFTILITDLIGKIVLGGTTHEKYFGVVQIIIILIVFLYGRYNAGKVKITNYDIQIDKESSLDKLEVILISDLHLGYFNDNKKFRRNVEKINSLKPDVVAIAGDLFDENFKALQGEDEAIEIFNKIKSTYGTYLSFGNHDAGRTFEGMKNFVQSTNIKLLEDETVTFDKKFAIGGRRDLSPMGFSGGTRHKDWNKDGVKDIPIILLDHQPIFKEYNKEDVDLILSGHTHKGQIFPFNLITKMHFENHYGYVKLKSGIQTIVTSGLGTWGPPVRLASRNEIVKINIRFNQKEQK
ncbi:metallophosphoesterase [uncultured Clostridium sp.]|uniref:metallophosphoesterase n=1 Tax=uncultured Clostridium sp. TaxID=59620 RepID=UPI00261ACE73|nr:metallophosphoesterase [uncultured Clostridium sp.]